MSIVALVTGGNRGDRLRPGRRLLPRRAPSPVVAEPPGDLARERALDLAWERALDLAWESFCGGTTPVGAVVTGAGGAIVAEGRGRRFEPAAPPGQLAWTGVAHAELNALAQLGPDRHYTDHALLTTLEPCAMVPRRGHPGQRRLARLRRRRSLRRHRRRSLRHAAGPPPPAAGDRPIDRRTRSALRAPPHHLDHAGGRPARARRPARVPARPGRPGHSPRHPAPPRRGGRVPHLSP